MMGECGTLGYTRSVSVTSTPPPGREIFRCRLVGFPGLRKYLIQGSNIELLRSQAPGISRCDPILTLVAALVTDKPTTPREMYFMTQYDETLHLSHSL